MIGLVERPDAWFPFHLRDLSASHPMFLRQDE
jgi:hypothetical protein